MDFTFLPNYFTIGSIVSTLFFSFLSYVFLKIKNPSKASKHLLLMVSYLAIFHLSYVITHGFSGIPTIWTRWLNNVTAILGATHAVQFFFYYPNDYKENIAKRLLYIQYGIGFIVSVYLLVFFWQSPFYYIFNSHFWDSDTLQQQQVSGIIIFLYFTASLAVGIWRATVEKGHQRLVVVAFAISFLLVMLVPGVFHVLSRDGLMERSVYMNSTVTFNLIGFFGIVIIFINNTVDRTTILVRLIGISVVTFLLMIQIMGFFWLQNVEDSYDQVHISLAKEYFVENHEHPQANYRLVYDIQKDKMVSKQGSNLSSIDIEKRTQISRNTSYYYRISHIAKDRFGDELRNTLKNSHPNFNGYKGWILTSLESGEFQTPTEFSQFIKNHENRIRYLNSKLRAIPGEKWEDKKEGFLANVEKSLPGFMRSVENYAKANGFSTTKELLEIQLSPIIQPDTRHFSGNINSDGETVPIHSVAYSSIIELEGKKLLVETGFNYKYYRQEISKTSWTLIYITFGFYLFILMGFRFFYGGALLQPIKNLVNGLTEVNEGNLDVNLKIKVEDEIGFMTRSFNNMTWSIKSSRMKLQEYAEQLEEKVEERTRELSDTLKKVNQLKEQQDGDYFLTTLLIEPLGFSEVNSPYINLESYVKQKKQFTFRKWTNNIGGDINIAQQITLQGKSHIAFVNADAMGKSMQGAGGALVLGSVFHTILDRTEMSPSMQMLYPERWLKNLFVELHKVFESFNGSMLMSGFFGVLDEESGFLYYLNCEHPKGVLYRDGKADFFEGDVVLRKLGTTSAEGSLKIETFQMEVGDVLFLGSDGRDDILTEIDENGNRVINEDETLFLRVVEEAEGDLNRIVEKLNRIGELTDDISLYRLERIANPSTSGETKKEGIYHIIQNANQFIEEEDYNSAIQVLQDYMEKSPYSPEIIRALSRLYYQIQNYEMAAKFAQDYLFIKPSDNEFLYFASLCFRRIKDYHKSIDLSERLRLRNFNFAKNLGLLADLHLKMGNRNRAISIYNELKEIDPDSNVMSYLREKLESNEEKV